MQAAAVDTSGSYTSAGNSLVSTLSTDSSAEQATQVANIQLVLARFSLNNRIAAIAGAPATTSQRNSATLWFSTEPFAADLPSSIHSTAAQIPQYTALTPDTSTTLLERVLQTDNNSILIVPFTQASSRDLNALAVSKNLLLTLPTGNTATVTQTKTLASTTALMALRFSSSSVGHCSSAASPLPTTATPAN